MAHARFNAIRRAFGRVIEGITVTVKHGPLAGKRLLLDSRREFRRGTYEPEQSQLFMELVKPGWVIYDIGAHLGYYSLLAAGLAGDTGRVVSFKPVPANLRRLYRHLAINHCSNVQVVEACVGDRAGVASFKSGYTSRSGRMTDEGELSFPVVSLDELLAEGSIPPPDLVKIDAEGAESRVLQGMRGILAQRPPVIFLSIHELDNQRERCLEFLKGFGYEFTVMGDAPFATAPEFLALPAARPDAAAPQQQA